MKVTYEFGISLVAMRAVHPVSPLDEAIIDIAHTIGWFVVSKAVVVLAKTDHARAAMESNADYFQQRVFHRLKRVTEVAGAAQVTEACARLGITGHVKELCPNAYRLLNN